MTAAEATKIVEGAGFLIEIAESILVDETQFNPKRSIFHVGITDKQDREGRVATGVAYTLEFAVLGALEQAYAIRDIATQREYIALKLR